MAGNDNPTAIEPRMDDARLFLIVADDDARHLGEPRDNVYAAAAIRLVVQIRVIATALEIQEWKSRFNGRARDCQGAKRGEGLTI
jgi:hypothetical protein